MNTIRVPLTQGKFALIDEIDASILDSKWVAHKGKDGNFYADRSRLIGENAPHTVKMHRVIMEMATGNPLTRQQEIDHINHDGLDNRRSNLRIASRKLNRANSKSTDRGNKSSVYKGVSWDKTNKRWHVQIYVNKKNKSVGFFKTEKEAAIAYDQAAFHEWGEYAYRNFPSQLNYEMQGSNIKAAIT